MQTRLAAYLQNPEDYSVEEAMALFNTILSQPQNDFIGPAEHLGARYCRANLHFQQGNYKESVEDATALINIENSLLVGQYKPHAEPYLMRANANLKLKNYQAVREDAEAALSIPEKKPEEEVHAYLLLSKAYKEQNKQGSAFNMERKAFSLQKSLHVLPLKQLLKHFILNNQDAVQKKGVRDFSQTKLINRQIRTGNDCHQVFEAAELTPESVVRPFRQISSVLIDNGITPSTLALARVEQELPPVKKDLFDELDKEEVRQAPLRY